MSTLLPTLTHARIRAAQGDVDGARAILEEILAACPEDAGARLLLREIAATPRTFRAAEPSDEPLPAPVAGDPALLAVRFGRDPGAAGKRDGTGHRAAALGVWLERIRKGRQRERAG